jgi:UDP-N-acetylmuramyl pentapeptide synthase
LHDVTFIAVTGSAGKTTTKEMIAAVLGAESRGRKTPAGHNDIGALATTVMRTTKRDDYCVVEVAAGKHVGMVARKAQVLRPNIAVVTTIGRDHHSTFRTAEATAVEKSALLDRVVAGGTAVLNADDPRVLAMGEDFDGQVVTYGCSPPAMVRAEDVCASWPQRLTFTLLCEGIRLPVRTQLVGKHWVTSVLAALVVARVTGLRLDGAVEAIAGMRPVPRRMEPVQRGDVTFIDDTVKAPYWALDTIFDFLADAHARRKILVMGTISDYPGAASKKYRHTADRGLAVADEVIFVGPNAVYALRTKSERAPEALRTFPSVLAASAYLADHLRPGDLVVLKGSGNVDGLEQIHDPRHDPSTSSQ